MTDFRSYLSAGLLGLSLALTFWQSADAVVFPHTYKVGPKPACDFTTIQEAIAAASSTAGDTIALDPALTYAGQHLDNMGKSLIFTAGAACTIGGVATATTTGTQATVSGDLNASAPVFKITGAGNVTLVDLKITGNTSSGNGGGIVYQGSGTLKLTNVAVLSNTANYGGGILFDGSGSPDAELILDTNTQIIGNTAMVSGGGIRVQGGGNLVASAAGNWIANNHAPNGYGGGIELYGATATLNSPGVAGNPLVYLNDAKYGGGIAIEAIAALDYYYYSTLTLGAVDARFPVRIDGNNATQLGGGIYLNPDNSNINGVSQATVFANRYRIDSNTAPEGSAIFGDCVGDLIESCALGSRVHLANVACASGVDCNTIDGNENEDSEHNPTDGSTVRFKNGGLDAHGLHMRGNLGGHVACSTDGGEISLYNSLLAENQVTQELIKADVIDLRQTTLANDSIDSAYTINHTSGDNLTLYNLVIAEDGTAALEGSLDNASIHNIVVKDAGGLPNAADIIETDPFFFDASGDYRLRLQTGGQPNLSSALDFSATSGFDDPVDIDSRPRNIDLQYVGERFGTIDLGAYEMQPITDRVFTDGLGDPIILVY